MNICSESLHTSVTVNLSFANLILQTSLNCYDIIFVLFSKNQLTQGFKQIIYHTTLNSTIERLVHGGSGSYRGHPPHELGVIDPFFWFSDSLGLYTWNITCGKNIVHGGLQGGHQSGTLNLSPQCLRKNFNADST